MCSDEIKFKLNPPQLNEALSFPNDFVALVTSTFPFLLPESTQPYIVCLIFNLNMMFWLLFPEKVCHPQYFVKH